MPLAQRRQLSRANAILVATTTFILISIGDGSLGSLFRAFPASFWLFDTLKFVALPAVLLYWLARSCDVTPKSYGLKKVAGHRTCVDSFGVIAIPAISLYFAYRFTGALFAFILGEQETPSLLREMTPSGYLHAPAVVYFAITAGLVEEIFFRGLPLLFLHQRMGTAFPAMAYVLGTSLLFGAAHWENGRHEVMATFCYGALSSFLYLKLRNLWPLVAAHTLIDLWDLW